MTAPVRVALVVGAAGDDRSLIDDALRAAGLKVQTARPVDVLATRDITPPAVLVLDDGTPPPERERLQAQLLSHPALHGAPLLVVADECTVESFAGAITKGAAAYLPRPLVSDDVRDAAARLATWPRRAGRHAEIRRRVRRPLLLDVDIVLKPGGERLRGMILDVSSGGCRMEVPRPIPRGTELSFIPRACERSTEIRLGGRVRWHRVAADANHLIAVRFAGASGLVAAQVLGATNIR